MEKIGKKFNLKDFKNYNVSYGTVDSTTSQSIYLSISTWVEPELVCFDSKKTISTINKTIDIINALGERFLGTLSFKKTKK